jgi:hypothetical protein
MSADQHSVCPKCYPFTDPINNEEQPEELRENFEVYIKDNDLHFDYSGDCWECGYHFADHIITPMTGLV